MGSHQSEVGGVNQHAGRLANGQEDLGAYDVVLELDYTNKEIRTYSVGGCQYEPEEVVLYTQTPMTLRPTIWIQLIIFRPFSRMLSRLGAGPVYQTRRPESGSISEPARLGLIVLSGAATLFIRRVFMI